MDTYLRRLDSQAMGRCSTQDPSHHFQNSETNTSPPSARVRVIVKEGDAAAAVAERHAYASVVVVSERVWTQYTPFVFLSSQSAHAFVYFYLFYLTLLRDISSIHTIIIITNAFHNLYRIFLSKNSNPSTHSRTYDTFLHEPFSPMRFQRLAFIMHASLRTEHFSYLFHFTSLTIFVYDSSSCLPFVFRVRLSSPFCCIVWDCAY